MKNLFKYLESNGIILLRNNSKYPILSFEKVLLENQKLQIPKNEINLFIKKFIDEVYKNKLGMEYIFWGNLKCLISREVFSSLYSLKINKTKKNQPLKKLTKEKYTEFEKRVYDFIARQNVTPQKYLENFFETLTTKSRNELDNALKRLQKDFWIIKVGQDKNLGQLWKVAWKYDRRFTRKVLKINRNEAIKKVVQYIIKSSNGITRPQIKKVLKNFVSNEEIDQVVTSLILENQVGFHKTLIINGKKALVAQ